MRNFRRIMCIQSFPQLFAICFCFALMDTAALADGKKGTITTNPVPHPRGANVVAPDIFNKPQPPQAHVPEVEQWKQLVRQLATENDGLMKKLGDIYQQAGAELPSPPGPSDDYKHFSQDQQNKITQFTNSLNQDKDKKDYQDFIASVKGEAGKRKRILTALQESGATNIPVPIPQPQDEEWWSKNVKPRAKGGNIAAIKSEKAPTTAAPTPPSTAKPDEAEKAKQAEAEKPKQAEAEKAKRAEAEKAKADADAKAKQAEAEKARKEAEAKARQAEAELDASRGDIAKVRGLAEKVAGRVNEMTEQNRLFFWGLGLGLISCLILAIWGLARKPKAIRASSELTTDMAARDAIRGLQQTVQSLAESHERDHATRSETVSASASLSALNETKAGIETQIRALSNKLLAAEREAAQLRSQLLSNPSSLAQFRESLQRSFDSASAVALPLLESVARLRERLQNDSFRKLARDRVEWTLLEGLTAEIERGLGEAEALLRALPGQLYVWEQPKFQAVIERCSQIEREVSRASSIRSSLVRLILPAYRTAAQREPLPKALDYARDFDLLMPSAGPLSWTMDCDGQGISADPNDARAPWHIRGSKRAGNRTVLFPICTENGSQLFPGVLTYEA